VLKFRAVALPSARRHLHRFLVAASAVAVAFAACGRGGPSVAPTPAGEPTVRIGLVTGSRAVRIRSDAEVAALSGGDVAFRLAAGDSVVLLPSGAGIEARGRAGGRFETLSFTSLQPGRYVIVNGKPYRGAIHVIARPDGLTAVDELGLESYLMGVVSAELGRRSGAETAALQAQAIVSRSYALRNRGRMASSGFDLSAGVTDQAYGGVASETPEGNSAVRSTQGMALTYQGQPIRAYFHSTCGYQTAAPEEAFRGLSGDPYLRVVSDKKPDGGYYCDISPRFRWTVTWEGTQLRDILRRTLPAVMGIAASQVDDIKDVRVRRTGPSGRAAEIRVQVGGGEIPVFGPDIRAVFQQPTGEPLGSAAIQLSAERDGDRLVRLVAAGAGWGHGVGMCQWGAVGRARAGQTYAQILSAYFPGATLQRMY
jgi:stage II sporulation protein D